MTEQETRSLRVPELVAARPPVSQFRAAQGFVMAGGQTELETETGVSRRTEGLPGTGGQVRQSRLQRHLEEAKNGGRWCCWNPRHRGFMNSYSWDVLPRDVLVWGACRFVQRATDSRNFKKPSKW